MKKINKITKCLLDKNAYEEGFWPWLDKGQRVSKKQANKFMLGCILDYQILVEIAWENARRLSEDVFGDPDDLWPCITNNSKYEWNAKRKEYSLHRFPKAHERVWRIGTEIVNGYDGDARNIWVDQSPNIIIERLNKMNVGEQISRMIVGALCDTEQIQGTGDVKVDIHVRRVLGRLLQGEGFGVKESPAVLDATRKMHPENPWKLDKPLFMLGKNICISSDPECDECYLQKQCASYSNKPIEGQTLHPMLNQKVVGKPLISYKGEFKVEDEDFPLSAERFILRDNEIAFSFVGSDEFGGFEIEGVATKSKYGDFFMAPKLPLKYLQYTSEDEASIKINLVKEYQGKKNNKCKVVGEWIQSGLLWKFTGTLKERRAETV